jgi:hypothetical protein
MEAKVIISISEEGMFKIESTAPAGMLIMMLADALGQVSRQVYNGENTEVIEAEVQ